MNQFYGQQDGERVLYKVETYPLVHILKLTKAVAAGVLLVILCWVLSNGIESAGTLRLIGLVGGIVVAVIGWWLVSTLDKKSGAYITDRRVVRFTATTPWTVNSRSISWDEVVKVKTKATGFIWRMLNVGAVIIHARSTVASIEGSSNQIGTDDDIQLEGIEYYQDLGNYLDKIVYTFKNDLQKMDQIREFVAKPKGKRY